jgi:hypothetical protein
MTLFIGIMAALPSQGVRPERMRGVVGRPVGPQPNGEWANALGGLGGAAWGEGTSRLSADPSTSDPRNRGAFPCSATTPRREIHRRGAGVSLRNPSQGGHAPLGGPAFPTLTLLEVSASRLAKLKSWRSSRPLDAPTPRPGWWSGGASGSLGCRVRVGELGAALKPDLPQEPSRDALRRAVSPPADQAFGESLGAFAR